MSGSPTPDPHAPPPAETPRVMIGTLSVVTFLVTGAGITLAPFLLDLARDLGATLGGVANLVALMSVSWGIVSVTAGAASDRIGRRPVLVAAVVTLGTARLGLTLSHSYGVAVMWQLLAGVGGGAFMGTVFAAVSDRVPAAQRGRALGWVITGQSLALVFGVPLVTLIGAFGGWRVAISAHAAAALLGAIVVRLAVPGDAVAPAAGRARGDWRGVVGIRILALLLASTTERTCFAAMAVYLATFLLTTYSIGMKALAVALALVALGNLGGNVLGGWLADRISARPLVFAVASLVTGVLGLPLMRWDPGVVPSVALGFVYSLANAAGRPALVATLAEVPATVRGAILGLNITMSSMGWLGAAALGGWLVSRFGFGSLGLLTAASGALGTLLALIAWRARRR